MAMIQSTLWRGLAQCFDLDFLSVIFFTSFQTMSSAGVKVMKVLSYGEFQIHIDFYTETKFEHGHTHMQ